MARKRKTKKPTVKRGKRSIRDVDVFTPDISDEALERAGETPPSTKPEMGCTQKTCISCSGANPKDR
jgi:hypothetical protein